MGKIFESTFGPIVCTRPFDDHDVPLFNVLLKAD